MRELKGFRPTLDEEREFFRQMVPELTLPEATAMAVDGALQRVWGLLSNKIGESKSTEDVFGVSYSELLDEYNRRRDLAGSSKAMETAKEKLR